MSFSRKRILICPLDWGLGHASRDIPVIKSLLRNNFEVIIAADNLALELLRQEFPELSFLQFPSYRISYPRNSMMVLTMLVSLPKIISGIRKEHIELRSIVKKHHIDIVISDNRFGLWNKSVFTIFITHQIMVKMPGWLKFLEYPAYRINRFIIHKYNRCWIPDNETPPFLAGDLPRKFRLPRNSVFAGLLSRFADQVSKDSSTEKKYDILVILSGPEPQRTIFEYILTVQIKQTGYRAIIIQGMPGTGSGNITEFKNISFASHLPAAQLENLISASDVIISRPGYTTIMDLIRLKKNAILVPTPGQTEQEYLAAYYNAAGIFYCVSQNEFDVKTALAELKKYVGKINLPEDNLLENLVKSLDNLPEDQQK